MSRDIYCDNSKPESQIAYITVSRDELNARLDGLRDAMASLRGCKRNERENEKLILSRVMKEIMLMNVDDQNPSVDERRVRLMEQAVEHLGEY